MSVSKYSGKGSRPKWRFRFRDGKDEAGKDRWITEAGFEQERDAKAAEQKRREEIKPSPAPPPSTEIAVKQWLATWLNTAAQECEHTTAARYFELARYITASDAPAEMVALAATPLATVRRKQIKSALLALKRAKAKRRRHLSAATVKHVRGLLSSAFSAATEEELMPAIRYSE
jgi:hypothetical protein